MIPIKKAFPVQQQKPHEPVTVQEHGATGLSNALPGSTGVSAV